MTTDNENNKLQKATPQVVQLALTADDFDDIIATSGQGRENIDAEDIRPPRMKLCQSGSPERKPDNPKQIKGLEELDLFNTLTQQKYGRDVDFVIVAFLGKSYVEFSKDLEVVDRDIKPGDPRTKFTQDPDDPKKSIKPVATTFYNFLLWLTDKQDMVLFSFKGSSISVAKTLINLMNSPVKDADDNIISMTPAPWTRLYHLQTRMISDGTYDYGGLNLTQKGFANKQLRNQITDFVKSMAGKKIVVDVDDAPETAGARDDAGDTGGQGDPGDM